MILSEFRANCFAVFEIISRGSGGVDGGPFSVSFCSNCAITGTTASSLEYIAFA